MIVEVSSKVPFWYPHDSRGVLEVSTCTLIIVEVSLRYLLVP